MSKTDLQVNTVEWNTINWRKIQKSVFKLQKRIYRAYASGDEKKGRRLQKTLINSYYNRLLSVRKVSQDNQGKKTAGVDKIKSLTPLQRLELANNLKLGDKSQPIRRVWIPKPGRTEKRPLGIPVMRDRAIQALAKTALEPEWEALFEENSYGFRPGRSAHDAIGAIFNQIRYKSKYVLDADISKCFDRINHQKLLAKLNTFPKLRKQIRAWLKADICDFTKHERSPNQQGTPQGGVISPLLSNIALHGMENRIKQVRGASLIRYADDFVIFHENLEVLKQCQKIICEWLTQFDLELKPCSLPFSEEDIIETDHITPRAAGGSKLKDNLQLLHRHCHDIKTKSDLRVIKRYKAQKEWSKTQKQFNNLNWGWVDDIPTLLNSLGIHKEPDSRGAQ